MPTSAHDDTTLWERAVKAGQKSLHAMVDKWIGGIPSRVTHIGRANSNGQRYAHVEAIGRADVLGIYFFRHADGSWGVFPSVGGAVVAG